MSKRGQFWRLLGGAASVTAIAVGIRRARKRAGLVQQRGTLTFDPQVFPTQTLTAGDFRFTWHGEQGGYLTIAHAQEPERILWASLPGESFVAAAQGRERITERHCHYKIRDQLQVAVGEAVVLGQPIAAIHDRGFNSHLH